MELDKKIIIRRNVSININLVKIVLKRNVHVEDISVNYKLSNRI